MSPRLSSLVLALLATSCGGDGGTEVDNSVTTVSVTPATATLNSLGATTQLSATASGAGGAVSGVSFTWTSSNPSVASVDGNGLVTAVSNGTSTITAAASGTTVSGSASITVAQTAATITVTPAVGMIVSGETLQLSAAVQDAGGSPLAAPNLVWSSSDAAIATVDATGLVTGVGSGAVVITASQDNATGTSALDVIRADFTPTGDVTLGGTLQVAAVTIPAGVTVTLTDNLVLNAEGPVAIAGTVIGDCLGLSLNGLSTITISGTFSNACSVVSAADEPPPLAIVAADLMILDGATITSSGDIRIANQEAPAALARSSAFPAGGSLPEYKISLAGTTIMHDPATAPAGEDGADGQDGHGITFQIAGELLLGPTTVLPQNGGPGGTFLVDTEFFLTNKGVGSSLGGAGGSGGNIDIEIVALNLMSVEPIVVVFGSGEDVLFRTGSGADGGTATWDVMVDVEGDFAMSGTSVGGAGGNGGNFTADGIAFSGPPLPVTLGPGGHGADGIANGAPGRPGTIDLDSQWGGNATGTGGNGGNAGMGPTGPDFLLGPAPGGVPGDGIAWAGSGGWGADILDGNPFGAGDDGGTATAFGGSSGNGWGMLGPPGGDAFVHGADGGNGGPNCPFFGSFEYDGIVDVLIDTEGSAGPALNVPPGGRPIFLLGTVLGEGGGPGTNGGNAGGFFGTPGLGGFDVLDPGTPGELGDVFFGPGANGGHAGPGLSGFPGGTGGLPFNPPPGPGPGVFFIEPVFDPGIDNLECFQSIPSAPLSTNPASAAALAINAISGTFTLTGAAPFVTVSGPLAEDGTITATGRGTVAFVPDVAVAFSGTLDTAMGTLVGEYSMDTEAKIVPGHPVVFSLNLTITPPAQSTVGEDAARQARGRR